MFAAISVCAPLPSLVISLVLLGMPQLLTTVLSLSPVMYLGTTSRVLLLRLGALLNAADVFFVCCSLSRCWPPLPQLRDLLSVSSLASDL